MQGELEYLSLECDSRHMQEVWCSMMIKGEVPRGSVKEYRRMLKGYKDETVLRIIEERDRLLEINRARNEGK